MEPYSEELIEHQYPVIPISEWQEWNDLGEVEVWNKLDERDFLMVESQERVINEFRVRQEMFDYSCQ